MRELAFAGCEAAPAALPKDLSSSAKAARCPSRGLSAREEGAEAEPLRATDDLLRQIAGLPLLAACEGLPQAVVRLAAEVTWSFPHCWSFGRIGSWPEQCLKLRV